MGSGGAEEALGGVGEGGEQARVGRPPARKSMSPEGCMGRAPSRPGRGRAAWPLEADSAPWWGWRPGLGVDVGAGFGVLVDLETHLTWWASREAARWSLGRCSWEGDVSEGVSVGALDPAGGVPGEPEAAWV